MIYAVAVRVKRGWSKMLPAATPDDGRHGNYAGNAEMDAVQVRWRIALRTAWIATCLVLTGAACAVRASGTGAQSARSAAKQQTPPPEARVDIKHATIDELMKVPGMTQTWAARIVRFRPYRTKQDLLDKGVVTSQVYDRIKDYVIAHRDKP
jgi:DNA uptake protein ComE-like DNA-binding protein